MQSQIQFNSEDNREILQLESEILELNNLLNEKRKRLLHLKDKILAENSFTLNENDKLPRWIIERYCRQALVSELGTPNKILTDIIKGSVLIIGAGGLGCPAAIYLVGAGIGHIGIVDCDDVEVTNIHRQPLHSELTLGFSKVDSAVLFLKKLNSNVLITPYNFQLNSSNALSIIKEYNVVIDATDNVVTRYLINDACVMTGKPLVSAAALQLSGQLTVYNFPVKNSENKIEHGPCYRCLFPTPPPPETVGSCSQNGVLGPIPGVMGCLQAIETIKILLGKSSLSGYLLIYDGSDCNFTKVKLRSKNKNCLICSENPVITKLIDYEKFCNAQASDKCLKLNVLTLDYRISPKDFFKNILPKIDDKNSDSSTNTCDSSNKSISFYNKINAPVVLIDVRTEGEFNLCKIEKSINCYIDKINYTTLAKCIKEKEIQEVYFVCRRGNDSQIAAKLFKEEWEKFENNKIIIKDIKDGLHGWSKAIDSNFPIY